MLNIIRSKVKNKSTDLDIYSCKVYDNYVSQNKYYPMSTKEWYNSVYTYNKNTIKLLPVADTVIINFIRSYFNFYNTKFEKKLRFSRLKTWQRRLSANRIIVSKAEIKHTNDKVFITIYLYNRQKRYIINKIKRTGFLFYRYNNFIRFLAKKPSIVLRKFLAKKTSIYLVNKRNLRNIKNTHKLILKIKKKYKYKSINLNLLKRRMKVIKRYNYRLNSLSTLARKIMSKVRQEKSLLSATLQWNNKDYKSYESFYIGKLLKKCLRKEVMYMYYKYILSLNKDKFNNRYIFSLKSFISKFYKKKVSFNLINLKYFHLNSDIFTQIITSKVRNRKKSNAVLWVLKASLRAISLPYLNKFTILDNSDFVFKKVQTALVKNLFFINKYTKFDRLEDNFTNYIPINIKKEFIKHLTNVILKDNNLINNYKTLFVKFIKNSLFNKPLTPIIKKKYDMLYKYKVINSLKHKVINGVRIEASGRLSKRNTAARSVFKLRYKGNLKNIDSSYKGIPSVMLRGHFKSNLQYTLMSSKRRIGAFGIKGWINSY